MLRAAAQPKRPPSAVGVSDSGAADGSRSGPAGLPVRCNHDGRGGRPDGGCPPL